MLIIVGLLVGGILVGQNLIGAAALQSQVTQIDKYNAAVNAFRGKYNALPGDIADPQASNFGFAARGANPGQGDGNGTIEGYGQNNGCVNVNSGWWQGGGETMMFWSDLTYANGMNIGMVEGSFNAATQTANVINLSGSLLDRYLPQAKIGGGNYVYAVGGVAYCGVPIFPVGSNYFALTSISNIWGGGYLNDKPGLTVQQAYAIDKKLDDGYPLTGSVMAAGEHAIGPRNNSATPGSATTCYDNGNAANAVQQYSLGQNNGSNVNCMLGFRFQ